ncbi:hypothetical protein DU976_17255 [Vibrio navarrensis]|nr:hypothetical protein [Vibrio navarrensis]
MSEGKKIVGEGSTENKVMRLAEHVAGLSGGGGSSAKPFFLSPMAIIGRNNAKEFVLVNALGDNGEHKPGESLSLDDEMTLGDLFFDGLSAVEFLQSLGVDPETYIPDSRLDNKPEVMKSKHLVASFGYEFFANFRIQDTAQFKWSEERMFPWKLNGLSIFARITREFEGMGMSRTAGTMPLVFYPDIHNPQNLGVEGAGLMVFHCPLMDLIAANEAGDLVWSRLSFNLSADKANGMDWGNRIGLNENAELFIDVFNGVKYPRMNYLDMVVLSSEIKN